MSLLGSQFRRDIPRTSSAILQAASPQNYHSFFSSTSSMEIPLKLRPEVSVVTGTVDNSTILAPSDLRHSNIIADHIPPTNPLDSLRNYKLTRTYSETETNNFDADTGHRLYDDGRIRVRPSRTALPMKMSPPPTATKNRLYARSHDLHIDAADDALVGLEDEYIPGLDFGDVLLHWAHTSESLTPASRDASYLDLNQLHAQVAPQPIQSRLGVEFAGHASKKLKGLLPVVNPKTGEVNYEALLLSLPQNFAQLPYLRRKRLVELYLNLIDYQQFSLFAKGVLAERESVSLGRRSENSLITKSASGMLRRSRRNSAVATTVAGRLLALSLSADLRKMQRVVKNNVDEKGAQVLGHELGKVIGFGAWGTIRECTASDGTVRALKIVRSSGRLGKVTNDKVLAVFRKEIAIWQQMKHPNILPLLNHVEENDVIFCLTNRITGGTLFEVVLRWGIFNDGVDDNTGGVSFLIEDQEDRLRTTAEFTRQIVEALSYMHNSLGIVHGDIKLENVLVDDLDPTCVKMVLCDFGMLRVFAPPRLLRKLSRLEDSSLMLRSRSSAVPTRKPYLGPHLDLFADDCKIGVLLLTRMHGPSLQSLDLTPTHTVGLGTINLGLELANFHEFRTKDHQIGGEIDSDLPHLHIGLLPYAAPELLNPLPPPLGPLADIWALGVLVFTMVTGRLPFQHPYEPRLRAIITAGKYNLLEVRQACLMDWVFEGHESAGMSLLVDVTRKAKIDSIRQQWELLDHLKYDWVSVLIGGCLNRDMVRRWDLETVAGEIAMHTEVN